jgi:membrane protein implicated in regulation of membrane protease activity
MSLNPTILWLLAGAILCLLEFSVPTAFVEFMMGLSAFVVAGISLFIPAFNLQVMLWMILSLTFVILSRRLIPRRSVSSIEDAMEGETLTEIVPGKTGRVLCDGISWQARCEGCDRVLAAHQRVIVVGREGNTLIVMPEYLLNS